MSTRAECRPTSRIRLVIKVISIPHDFFRGPHMECESASLAISVAAIDVGQSQANLFRVSVMSEVCKALRHKSSPHSFPVNEYHI